MASLVAGKAVKIAGETVPVMRILGRNAGPMTGPGTNTYLVGSEHLSLIDPGPEDPVHMQCILDALDGRPLRRILVTHTHGDHSPGATPLARETGASLVGIAAPSQGRHDQNFKPDREFHHGEIIDCHEYRIEIIHTPGHVSNHLCYLLQEEKLLFTGDHILQGTTSVILPPDGDMSDYMQSLSDLQRRSLNYLAPGHGELITDPNQAIASLIAHRQRREQKIVLVMDKLGPVDIEKLTPRVYDDVASHLWPWAKLTLQAHLIKLQRESRVAVRDSLWALT